MFQTQRDFEDFGIPYNIEYLENISKSTFKVEVKKRAQLYFFKCLILQKNNHSKMKKNNYEKLEIQPYLTSEDITIDMKKIFFSWKTRMAAFSNNYRGGKEPDICKLCG